MQNPKLTLHDKEALIDWLIGFDVPDADDFSAKTVIPGHVHDAQFRDFPVFRQYTEIWFGQAQFPFEILIKLHGWKGCLQFRSICCFFMTKIQPKLIFQWCILLLATIMFQNKILTIVHAVRVLK